jgi:hypothetical protein
MLHDRHGFEPLLALVWVSPLGAGVVLMLVMLWIIDPKLKAISEDYEAKQKQYLEDLEKIARWED